MSRAVPDVPVQLLGAQAEVQRLPPGHRSHAATLAACGAQSVEARRRRASSVAVGGGQPGEELRGVGGAGGVDLGADPPSLVGRPQDHRPAVGRVGRPLDQAALLQPVGHLGRRPGRDVQRLGEVGEPDAVPLADDAERAGLVRGEVPRREDVRASAGAGCGRPASTGRRARRPSSAMRES